MDEFTQEPVCPNCHQIYTDVWEVEFPVIEEAELQCPYCEKKFICNRHITVEYTTRIPEGDVCVH